MSANKKTVFKGFDYMHCDDFAKYLNEMAAKGWHFKEWGLGLKFEKGEPEYAIYAVEVFTDASEYDMRPEPNTTRVFAEYCEAAGWELIDAKQKFCIFKQVKEDAVPILTPEERLNNVCKEMRFSIWANIICEGVLVLMCCYDMFGGLAFQYKIFSALSLYFLLFWTVMFLSSLYNGISFYWWKHKMKKQLQNGDGVYIGDEKKHILKDFPRTFCVTTCLLLSLFINGPYVIIYMGGFFTVMLIFSIIINKVRPDSDTNFIWQSVLYMVVFVSIIVYGVAVGGLAEENHTQTDAPLLKVDYRETLAEVEEITLYKDSNLLGSRETYLIDYEENGLHYHIYASQYDWILDRIIEEELERKVNENIVDCTKEWGAESAFYNMSGDYYVRYENVLVIFTDYDEIILTQDQVNTIRDKLDLR